MNSEQIKCEMKGSQFFILDDIKIPGIYCLCFVCFVERDYQGT